MGLFVHSEGRNICGQGLVSEQVGISPDPFIIVIYPTPLCHHPIFFVAPRFSNTLPNAFLDIGLVFTTA